MTGWVAGSVSILRCAEEGHLTPHLTFLGDTDMVTAGLASLSSMARDEIIVKQLEAAEFDDAAGLAFQMRINAALARDDLRFVRLLRAESVPVPEGLSFQDFQRVYRLPKLISACPHCDGGEAVPVHSVSVAEYKHAGGIVTVLIDIDVRD